MPAGIASGVNEIKQRRDSGKAMFREWLPADPIRMGMMRRSAGVLSRVCFCSFMKFFVVSWKKQGYNQYQRT